METKKEIDNSKFSIEEIIEMQLLKVIKKYDILVGLCFSISKELGENLINFFKEENKDELDKLGRAPTILKYKIDVYAKLAANTEDVYHEVLVKASIFNFTNNCLFTLKIELVNPDDKFIINTIIHNHSAFNHMLII